MRIVKPKSATHIKSIAFAALIIIFIILAPFIPYKSIRYLVRDEQLSATRDMGKIMEKILREPGQDFVESYEHTIQSNLTKKDPPGSAQFISRQYLLASLNLSIGKIPLAIDEIQLALNTLKSNSPMEKITKESYSKVLAELLALCYLREAENVNCISHHGSQSCIFPFTAGGIHKYKIWAELAAAEYKKLLRIDPARRDWIWLRDLSEAVAGKGSIKKTFLPAQTNIVEQRKFNQFTDVSTTIGIIDRGGSGGVIIDDFRNSGSLDIVTSSIKTDRVIPGEGKLKFFRNDNGKFTEISDHNGLEFSYHAENLTQADYNNDGLLDIVINRGGFQFSAGRYPISLYKNLGGGIFEDTTIQSGLLFFAPTMVSAWGDFDNDGWLDLFIGVESDANISTHSKLFHNNGDGTFTDIAKKVGIDVNCYVTAALWFDYNNDNLQDLFVSCAEAAPKLFKNLGKQSDGLYHFTDVANTAGLSGPQLSHSVFAFDYDNDGCLDLAVFPVQSFNDAIGPGGKLRDVLRFHLNGAGLLQINSKNSLEKLLSSAYLPQENILPYQPHVFHNECNGRFKDVTKELGLQENMLVWGSNFGDVDNDGWPDFYLGTGNPSLDVLLPNRLFHNVNGKYFEDVTLASGTGHLQKGHGVSFADINNDGWPDIFVSLGGRLPKDKYQRALFANPGFNRKNKWIKLILEGVKSNRSAIGTKIEVNVATPDKHSRSIFSWVGSGSSFGNNPLRREIGLGEATKINFIKVTWPASGEVQIFHDALVNSFYKIKEFDEHLSKIKYIKWDFPLGH